MLDVASFQCDLYSSFKNLSSALKMLFYVKGLEKKTTATIKKTTAKILSKVAGGFGIGHHG